MRRRATSAELETRTAAVAALVVAGASRSDVLAVCAEAWGVSARTGDRLLAFARAQIRADWDLERPDLTARLLSTLSDIEMQAREAGNLGLALRAIDTVARLAGLV